MSFYPPPLMKESFWTFPLHDCGTHQTGIVFASIIKHNLGNSTGEVVYSMIHIFIYGALSHLFQDSFLSSFLF